MAGPNRQAGSKGCPTSSTCTCPGFLQKVAMPSWDGNILDPGTSVKYKCHKPAAGSQSQEEMDVGISFPTWKRTLDLVAYFFSIHRHLRDARTLGVPGTHPNCMFNYWCQGSPCSIPKQYSYFWIFTCNQPSTPNTCNVIESLWTEEHCIKPIHFSPIHYTAYELDWQIFLFVLIIYWYGLAQGSCVKEWGPCAMAEWLKS